MGNSALDSEHIYMNSDYKKVKLELIEERFPLTDDG